MASPSINVRITGSGQRPSSLSLESGKDGISGSLAIQHKTKAIQLMSTSNSNTSTSNNTHNSNTTVEPEEVTVNIKKPSIAKLTAEALNTTASLVEQIGNEDSDNAADIMRKSA
ncbi:MAG: hypothetical protein KGZ51_03535, partial [Erysipelothrix sp.]|nr:hypothetical protein [Erysipelothrix sp.]